MPNNCLNPEMCLLSETCVPCAICPNAKEKADEHSAKLERERNALRCELVTLRVAAQGVIDRWDSPLWKDAQATAKYIHRLRAALCPANVDVDARRPATPNQTGS